MVKSLSIVSIVLISICCITCNKPDISKTASLRFGKLLVFGHGGSGFGIINTPHPANSTESIQAAYDFHGADGVEIDIQVIKDSVIVAYHDQDLITQTNCQGCLQQTDSISISHCAYRKSFIKEEKGSAIAFLNDILQRFSSYEKKPHLSLNVHLHYDCLPYEVWRDYDIAFARSLVRIIENYNAEDWAWVESEVPEFLQIIKSINPNIWLYYIQSITPESIDICVQNQFKGLIASHTVTNAKQIQTAHDNGLYVSIYNANIRSDIKEAINNLPDFIQTDNIILTKQLLKE